MFRAVGRLWGLFQAGLAALVRDVVARHRALVIVAAGLIAVNALGVLAYVLSIPEIGVKAAFYPIVNRFDESFLYPPNQSSTLRPGDQIEWVGDSKKVLTWPQFNRLFLDLRDHDRPDAVTNEIALKDPELKHTVLNDVEIVRVQFVRDGKPGSVWCSLARTPLNTFAPTMLWILLKAGLFLVGAFVLWKRPGELAARQFFVLTVVSFGAYVGGYHWQRIATQPTLLLVFAVSAVFLPSVSLHFYLAFPRPNPVYQRHPGRVRLALYGPPTVFVLVLLYAYLSLRLLSAPDGDQNVNAVAVGQMFDVLMVAIYLYFGVALLYYLLSLVSLIYSYRTARDTTERNQVKWILFGSGAALVPLGYSLYLALLEQNRFGGGAATWPMFAASLCVTVAFAVAITRYRLMQLDQLVSSGAVYFAISAMAALFYYGLVLCGILLLGSRMVSSPSLVQALGVGGTVLLLLVILDLARGRIKKVLDRHFRREKLQLEQTLQRMSEAVSQLVDPPTLARRLLQTTTDLLGVERGRVYLKEGAPPLYRLADSLGGAPPLTELPPGCPLVAALEEWGYLHRPGARGAGDPAGRQLHFLGGEVAYALAHEGRTLALLVLGPRASGGYSGEDLNLLSAFAQVTVLALVSSEGGRTVEALNRDLKAKVEKIAEQQRRILALQSQLTRRERTAETTHPPTNGEAAPPEPPAPPAGAAAAGIIGSSPALRQLLHLVKKVSGSGSAVLLRGESGTGKELLARAVHDNSPRAGKPFVKVHCAALSPTLLESELFGHVKGAFTGAVRDRVGRFELANSGTLFLDEIGDVSLELQTKLLRVLQEMTFERVGSSEPIQVDVRIIAATHQDLEKLIRLGRFREDLFYRLNVLPITVPPLRERREDVPELVDHFLRVFGPACGKAGLQIDDDALALMKAAPWPGNIRQLENVIERAVVVAEGNVLTLDDLPLEQLTEADPEPTEPDFVVAEGNGLREEAERRDRERLVRALASSDGNKSEAARALGLARSTFMSRLKKYGLS